METYWNVPSTQELEHVFSLQVLFADSYLCIF